MSEQTVMEDVGIVFVCVELTDVEDGLVRSSYYTITSGNHQQAVCFCSSIFNAPQVLPFRYDEFITLYTFKNCCHGQTTFFVVVVAILPITQCYF